MRLRKRGAVGKAESVVVLVTGSGFKDLGVVGKMVGEAPVIRPSVEELKRYL
jgi:threonine synthase